MISLFDIDAHYGELIERVYASAIEYLGLEDEFDVDISFVSEDNIREINRETREIDSVTDVLSFPNLDIKFPFNKEDYPYDVDRETGRIMLGDIIICKKRMLEQAEEYAHSDVRECAFLTLHGLLHLFGFDHIEEEDRIKMRAAEEEVLSDMNITREER